ncbi:long-chain-fatty-acid--CoA ligase [Ruegeria pomeroyi]|uniref:3-methylmercaptopropionyl-CoA ligase n=1 Tax=Ruegeria pomeroyi TaxID=89184 RepID=A0A9Q3WM45_9RHOB|nr:long-chain-fatty-acid--CoA ligase [Ruegeria pomeroyi]MCE8537912.1 long-chain-fatty-acid--CoA ligase [Ruegeria pomeroyi]
MTMPPQLSLMIQRNDAVCPKSIASVFHGRRKTWGEIAARVARIAGGLRTLGLKEGDRVAMLALNSDRYLEFFFATSWAGLVFVPINIRLAPPEVVHWLSDSGSKALIVDDTFLKMIPAITPHLPDLAYVIHAGDSAIPDGMASFEALAQASGGDPSPRCGDELAGIFYTGGTTGVSKGVMLSHGNLVHNAMLMTYHTEYPSDPVYLHAAPMFHLADGASTFSQTMIGGAHAYVPAFTPESTLEAIERDRVTNVTLVPVMVNMLVHHPSAQNRDLSSLRIIGYGASPMPKAVLEKAMALMPNVRFFQAYGQTEVSPILTILSPQRHVFDGPMAGKAGSVGQPCLGMDARILDPDGNEVPRGTIGEVCARGPNVMLGYWNRPEQTAEVSKHGWHHTGDGGYMDEDGFIYIVDRMKDMIISGGENVYSAEVENALFSHSAVAECAVIGVPDDDWGERVHAVVRLHEGSEADAEALRTHCHTLIAGYKCPRSFDFVTTPLPLSGAGKILKTELRKPYWEGQSKQVH